MPVELDDNYNTKNTALAELMRGRDIIEADESNGFVLICITNQGDSIETIAWGLDGIEYQTLGALAITQRDLLAKVPIGLGGPDKDDENAR